MDDVYAEIFETQQQIQNAPQTTSIFVPPEAEARKRNRHPNHDRNLRHRLTKKSGQGNEAALDDDTNDAAGYKEHPANDVPSQQTRSETWTDRRTREYNDYVNVLDSLKQQRVHCLPLHTALTSRIRASELTTVQNCINESLRFHECFRSMDPAARLPATFVSARPVTYFSMNCRHTVQLPTWSCNCCQKFYTASPVSVCCWPTTACHPAAFVHESVLGQYSSMFRSGVGLDG